MRIFCKEIMWPATFEKGFFNGRCKASGAFYTGETTLDWTKSINK
jgi:hypothetical protein